jgi:hypothetical protein
MANPIAKPPTDLNRLSTFLSSIGSASEDMILAFGLTKKLYHYTNLEGLLAILESKDLRLTHSRYSNDEAEMTHGLRLTREVIAAEQAKAFDQKRRTYLDELSNLFPENEIDPVYISCFCEDSDKLSQWRAYAANGTGVSLEFDPSLFSAVTGADSPGVGLMRFWKVFYPDETKKKIVRSAINYYPSFEPGSSSQDWARWASEAIRFFVPTFKHKDFSEEAEWRLIFTPSPSTPVQPSYRVSRGMLIPFYSLKAISQQLGQPESNLALCAVRIGPSPNKLLNVASVRMLLDKHGYSSVTAESCEIPYRG